MAFREDMHVTKLRVGNNKRIDNGVFNATFTNGAEAANVITVAVQLLDARDKEIAERCGVIMYLSSDANGDLIEPSSATLSVAAGTDGIVSELNTDNTFLLISESDGDIDVAITETVGANTFYMNLIMPATGKKVTSGAITFA